MTRGRSLDPDEVSFVPHPPTHGFVDITGCRYGRLAVLGYAGRRGAGKRPKPYWFCECDCGAIKLVGKSALSRGTTTSCGCFHRERATESSTTHGRNRSPEYRSFHSAKNRCTNPNNDAFDRYGGRGIEFRFGSLDEFLATLGKRPSPQHSLDRIDNAGHYEPGNVRWATPTEQARNTRRNRLLTIRGETKTQAEWAATAAVGYVVMLERTRDLGWCSECAHDIPARGGTCSHK